MSRMSTCRHIVFYWDMVLFFRKVHYMGEGIITSALLAYAAGANPTSVGDPSTLVCVSTAWMSSIARQ